MRVVVVGAGIGSMMALATLAKANVTVVCPEEFDFEPDVFALRPEQQIKQDNYFKDNHKRRYRGKQRRVW